MAADLRLEWETDGAVTLRGIVPHKDIDTFAKNADLFRIRYCDVDEALGKCPARAASGILAAWAEFLESSEWVLRVQLAARVRQALQEILDGEPVGRWSHFSFISPGAHPQNQKASDTSHVHNLCLQTHPFGKAIISWMPVDDVDPAAGPMWIIRGSHKKFMKFADDLLGENPVLLEELQQMWKEGASGEQWEEWILRAEERSKPVFNEYLSDDGNAPEPVLLKKGDVLLFSPALLHGTFPAQNPAIPRRAIISQYQAANCELWEIGDAVGGHRNPGGPGYYNLKEWTRTKHGLIDATSRYKYYSSMKGYLHKV